MEMRFIYSALAAALTLAMLAQSQATAQERTREGAQTLITSMSVRGSTSAMWFPIASPRVSVVSAFGSECSTVFVLADGNQITVSWSKVSEVRYSSFAEGLMISAGDFPRWAQGTNSLVLAYDSEATANRVRAAGEFLRRSCDTLASTGF